MDHLFNKKIDFKRKTEGASDGMGGYVEVESTLHAGVPCRINWTKGSERILQFDKRTYYRDGKLYCRVKSDVTTKDTVVYGGAEYEIVDVRNVDEADCYMIVDIKKIA